jgi:hypothetical protein
MRAMTYHGAHDVRVETVPDPKLEAPDDIILRVTATAICGSDLHLYRGKIPTVEHGDIFGHEFMGIVEETGPGVTAVQRGDRVVIPFVIACGDCFFCQQELYAACETTNSGAGAAMNKKAHTTAGRAVRLQPDVWRHSRRPSGAGAGAQGQYRALYRPRHAVGRESPVSVRHSADRVASGASMRRSAGIECGHLRRRTGRIAQRSLRDACLAPSVSSWSITIPIGWNTRAHLWRDTDQFR